MVGVLEVQIIIRIVMKGLKNIKPHVYYISAAIISIILYYGYDIDILPLFINTLIIVFIGNFLISLRPLIKESLNKEKPPEVEGESAIITHLIHIIETSVDDEGDYNMEEDYKKPVSLDTFIGDMTDAEFAQFLNKDKYGNDNPDKEAILNLLKAIGGKAGFESKEKLIYIKLAELKKQDK